MQEPTDNGDGLGGSGSPYRYRTQENPLFQDPEEEGGLRGKQ